MQALIQQGENAMLQNASATGGLRGGNLQAALAQFRPQMLNALIDQQFSRLGGLTTLGQNAAAGQAAAGTALGANVSGLLGQQGAATAGGQIARGNVARQSFGDLLQVGGTIAGAMGGFGGMGAGGGAPMGSGGNIGFMGGGQGLRPSGSIFQ